MDTKTESYVMSRSSGEFFTLNT